MSLFSRCFGIAAVFALALAGSPVVAQQAPAPAPTEAQMVLARQIVTGSGMGRTFDGIVPQLVNQIGQSVSRTRPELTPDLKVVLLAIEAEFLPQTAKMLDIAANVFATKMSEAEMKDVAVFFSSASGKKYVANQPVVLDEIVVGMDAWRAALGGQMSQRVREEMKKKGHDL